MNRTDGLSLGARKDDKVQAVRGDVGGTCGPPDSHVLKPSIDFLAKRPVPGIVRSSELLGEAVVTKEGNADHARLGCPAFPDQPSIKVENPRSIRKSRHNPALDGYRMILDFGEEGVTESNCVLKLALRRRIGIAFPGIPEAKLIELCGIRDYVTPSLEV